MLFLTVGGSATLPGRQTNAIPLHSPITSPQRSMPHCTVSRTVTTAFASVSALLLVAWAANALPAQTGNSRADQSIESDGEAVPQAALLTERGRQLAQELQMLRRSRAAMGSKHPTLPLVNEKIAAIEEQLEAWEPAYGETPDNPFDAEKAAPKMNEYDLRQVVIRLSKRVEQLERRVTELERRR